MSCDCSCSMDERPSVYWDKWRTARKQHICCECGSDIDPGEQYYQVKGVWDGEFQTFKTCLLCQGIRNEAFTAGEECICFGDLWEAVGNEFEA